MYEGHDIKMLMKDIEMLTSQSVMEEMKRCKRLLRQERISLISKLSTIQLT